MNRQKTVVIGRDDSCKYYPCHVEGQDCTWCYCPFYPCEDDRTGGRRKSSSRTGKEVWTCIDCTWVHGKEVAQDLAEAVNGDNMDRKELLTLRRGLLEGDK